jgi:hypothetical protein
MMTDPGLIDADTAPEDAERICVFSNTAADVKDTGFPLSRE